MRYRLVHTQVEKGPMIIVDTDQGVPVEHLDMERKQPVYVPFHKKSTVTEGPIAKVVTDLNLPGFIDLVPSDKVKLSVEHGVIKVLADKGYIHVVELPTGFTGAAPTIASAVQDDNGNGDVTVSGTGFLSYVPYATSVTLVEDAEVDPEVLVLSAGDAGISITNTSIVVARPDGDDTFVGGTVTVAANGQVVASGIVGTA
jgi:hypothetical protein